MSRLLNFTSKNICSTNNTERLSSIAPIYAMKSFSHSSPSTFAELEVETGSTSSTSTSTSSKNHKEHHRTIHGKLHRVAWQIPISRSLDTYDDLVLKGASSFSSESEISQKIEWKKNGAQKSFDGISSESSSNNCLPASKLKKTSIYNEGHTELINNTFPRWKPNLESYHGCSRHAPFLSCILDHRIYSLQNAFGKYGSNSFHSVMFFSTGTNLHCSNQKSNEEKTQVQASDKTAKSEVLTTVKVAQAGKDMFYTFVVVGGLIVIGGIFYAIGRELFSVQSPSSVYAKALKQCRKNEEVEVILGLPLLGKGETNRRGRSRYVSHTEFIRDGVPHMRMKFYVKGPHKQGTVHLEVKMNESNKYETRYLFIEVDDFPSRTIVIEDNR